MSGPTSAKKKPRRYQSITFEISFLYSFILLIILIIFSGFLYVILFRTVLIQQDDELELVATNISASINSYLEVRGEEVEPLKFALENTIQDEKRQPSRWWSGKFEKRWFKQVQKLDLSDFYINFISINRASLARSPNIPDDLIDQFRSNVDLTKLGSPTYQTVDYARKKIRIINYPFTYKGEEKYILQVGTYQKEIIGLIFSLLTSVLISIPIFLILTSFIGRVFVRRILKPVENIASIARKISYEDLSARVETKNVYKEIRYLIDDFNEMINRLEQSFALIDGFSSHVAHELKTPLTIIKGETELALMEKRSEAEYRSAMKINLEEVDRMLRIINDLLLLTRIDHNPQIFQFEDFDFISYFGEIVSQVRMLARSKSIKIKFNLPNTVENITADKVHLRRLFFNILDNAMKFTPENGTIEIELIISKSDFLIKVKDSGCGISPADLPKIFHRFYHSAKDGHHSHGLGLSIAQSIARLHKGSISVKSRVNQGATFHIFLPRSLDNHAQIPSKN
ncbi:MAG: HAMP domain-containing protein [Candidatus Omnitrophica bacterium]|nr:HAMP domain-containing protein [Candidatus Omnitrophota bacterium]